MSEEIKHTRMRGVEPLAIIASVVMLLAVMWVYGTLAEPRRPWTPNAESDLAAGDSLTMHAFLPKSTYTSGEDISLVIYLVNRANRRIFVQQPVIGDNRLITICRDSYGNVMLPAIESSGELATRCDSLLPDDSTMVGFNLAEKYGSHAWALAGFAMHPVGQFTVQVELDKRTRSNVLEYRVTEPGDDDRAIFAWLEAHKKQVRYLRDLAPQMEGLLQNYPSAAYAAKILQLLFPCYQTGLRADKAKVADYARRLAELYKFDRESSFCFGLALDNMSYEEGKAYTFEVADANPGTFLGRVAAERRSVLEKEAQAGKPDSLAFQIRLDKSEYLRGEVVRLHLFIFNLTDDTLHTVIPDLGIYNTVEVHLVDSSGTEIPVLRRTSATRRICQQELLLPHDTLLGILNLSGAFDQRDYGRDILVEGQLPGVYTVDAVYLDRLVSNTVSFSVLEPEGSEANVFRLYRSILESERAYKIDDMLSKMQTLLELFPKSAYAPQTQARLSSTFLYGNRHDEQKLIAHWKRLIDNYPNSSWCQSAFGGVVNYQTEIENRAYYRTVIQHKPGRWAARVARNLLTRPELAGSSKDGIEARLDSLGIKH